MCVDSVCFRTCNRVVWSSNPPRVRAAPVGLPPGQAVWTRANQPPPDTPVSNCLLTFNMRRKSRWAHCTKLPTPCLQNKLQGEIQPCNVIVSGKDSFQSGAVSTYVLHSCCLHRSLWTFAIYIVYVLSDLFCWQSGNACQKSTLTSKRDICFNFFHYNLYFSRCTSCCICWRKMAQTLTVCRGVQRMAPTLTVDEVPVRRAITIISITLCITHNTTSPLIRWQPAFPASQRGRRLSQQPKTALHHTTPHSTQTRISAQLHRTQIQFTNRTNLPTQTRESTAVGTNTTVTLICVHVPMATNTMATISVVVVFWNRPACQPNVPRLSTLIAAPRWHHLRDLRGQFNQWKPS